MSDLMLFEFQHVTVRENKDGTLRYYFRRRGQPVRRLPGEPGSEEFAQAYQRELNRAPESPKTPEGSFAWLCDRYMSSTVFTGLSKATRDARRRIILTIMKEPIAPGHKETFGEERLTKIGPKHIRVLRDRKADNPNAANERLKVLSQIFKFAQDDQLREDNPVRDVRRLNTKSEGHKTATDEHIAAYFAKHTAGSAWLAMKLLTYFGVRVSDLRVLGRQHVRKGYLVFDTVKTGVRCELEIDEEMAAILPHNGEHMTFLLSDHGEPYKSDKAMSKRVSEWFSQADVEGVTAHSVRKWLATKMAENGDSEMELMSWFGWRDPKEARPYVQAANRKKMASRGRAKIAGV